MPSQTRFLQFLSVVGRASYSGSIFIEAMDVKAVYDVCRGVKGMVISVDKNDGELMIATPGGEYPVRYP